jgi:hypothetical protein
MYSPSGQAVSLPLFSPLTPINLSTLEYHGAISS